MTKKKEKNLVWRRGRKGEGWYGDFQAKEHRFRPFLGTDLRRARLELGKLKALEAGRRVPVSKDVTLEEFAQEYMELHAKNNKAESSQRRDEVSIKSLAQHFRDPLRLITSKQVEEYKAMRRDQGKSAATVNRELACLRIMLNKAVEWDALEENPVKKIRPLKETDRDMRILTADQETRLIESAAPHLKAILTLLLHTGLRRNEALSVRWKDVDFDLGFIEVTKSKNGKQRKLPLTPEALDALQSVMPGTGPDSSSYVFGGIKDVKTAFHTACRLAGIDGLRLHDLRHTFATRLVRLGVDLVTVSRLLGHSSILMTMRYAHPLEDLHGAVMKLSGARASRQVVDHEKSFPLVN